MKKFIVAAVLAIVLSFSLVVSAFAETPVRIIGSYYYYPYSSWSGSGFGGGTHTVEPSTKTLTVEDFLSLYYGAVESNSNSYSFSLRQSGSYTFIAVYSPSSSKVLGRLCDSNGLVYRCASIVHSELFLLSSIIGYIDQIEGRLARTVNDITYTVADSTYNTWKTLESMSGTLTSIAARMLCYTDSGVVNTVAESAYWSFAYQKYTYNRLSDIISAIESIGVASVTLDGVQLNIDSSNINLWNNNAYCCGYRVTVDDVPYEIFEIPYDTATAIVARLNTDYVGQGVTLISRDGTTYTRYVRSATILPDGYIRVKLTNGYNYYLCDNVNVLYVVDMNSNYGSRIDTTLNNVISRLDTIIENQQISSGLSTCDHQYVSEVSQEPDCTLPGLMVHTCELCEASYSEIMDPLGHDWLCTDHVEAVTDENGEVLESGYDIYTCQRCDQIYYDYDGTGAPDPGHGSTVTDLITAVFTKLGNFVGGLVSAVINLLDKLLTGFDSIVSDFNDRTNQIVNFGGAYPAWLGGIWEIIPADLQLALGFCVVCLALGIIGKKVVFS